MKNKTLNITRIILVSFFLHAIFYSSTIFSATWVEVVGKADMSAGKKTARRLALIDAYRNAIDAGGLVEVKSYSKVRDFEMVTDVVSTQTHGYIKSFTVLSEGPLKTDSSIYTVKIKASIIDSSERNNEGLATLVSIIGTPKILFILSDKNGEDKYHSAEQLFAESFVKVGYEVITSDLISNTSANKNEILQKARLGNIDALMKLARSVSADLVLIGQINSQFSEMSGETDVAAKLGVVNLTSKVISPSNGKIIDVSSSRERFMSVQSATELDAIEGAIKKAVTKVANKFKWQVPKLLTQAPKEVQLEIHNVSFKQNQILLNIIEKVAGINQTELVSWDNQVSTIKVSVDFTGPKAVEIAQSILRSDKNLNVSNLSDYRISLTY